MRIELTTSRASVRGFWAVGDIIDVPAKEARKLIAEGSAIPVRQQATEKAVTTRAARRAVADDGA